MSPTSEVLRLTRRRTLEIFTDLQQGIYKQTDHLFAVLMAVQWVFGIAVALWVSPRAWAGATSQVHIHVWAAIFLGGAISAFPIGLALLCPGRSMTRYSIAVGQMLTSALLIHLTGGRIETHFHVFGSLAFLAFYRDWRVLIPATVVIAGDHLLRGMLWPQSVYGVLVASQWRFLEHAAWVVFEDIVLVLACIRGTRELWSIAERTAEFETSEERYRAVVEQTAEGIFVFDVLGRVIVEFNAAFLKLLDVPRDAVTRLAVDDALLAGNEPLDQVVAALVESRVPIVTERRLTRANGTTVPVSCSLSATSYAGNQAICAVIRDISEHKRIEAEIARARDAAIESARLKSQFLANMSHEIRTPMNGVVGMAGLLLETNLTAEQRDFADTIQTSADSLLTIINDILDFSKVEAGKLQFEVLDFDLRQAIEGSVDLLAGRAFAKGVELATLIDRDVPTALRGDPGRLRQVIMNLVGNAVKFTEHGEVLIRASLDRASLTDVTIRFEVKDTGIGISEEHQERLFEAFTQADGSTTRKYGGTGLGLAISKRLVELMDGQIGVTGAPGAGSTFWFTAKFQKQPVVQQGDTIPFTALEGRRALVVDDNETNRRILHYQLTSWGVQHRSVSGGQEALVALRDAVARNERFELAILDRQMPGMDGLALARAIKQEPAIADVRMVMMTSLGDRGDGDKLIEAGIVVCMTKPIKQAQLRECLSRVLAHQSNEASVVLAARPTEQQVPTAIRARVLVAEDNIVNQKVVLLQLRRLGYAADAVANGAEAVEALSRIPYDVVLMDCQMPEVDGFEATRRIRSEEDTTRRLPIIAMTANALAGDREQCLKAGMDDYISKPVKAADLHVVLMRWAGKPQERDEAVGVPLSAF